MSSSYLEIEDLSEFEKELKRHKVKLVICSFGAFVASGLRLAVCKNHCICLYFQTLGIRRRIESEKHGKDGGCSREGA